MDSNVVGIRIYREQAKTMLIRWGKEIAEGGGKPNIIWMFGRIGGSGEYQPETGPSFSPLAEKADKILYDMKRLDGDLCRVLVAVSLRMSVTDIARSFKWSRSKAQLEVENGLAAFATAVWYRTKVRRWDNACTCLTTVHTYAQ